MTAAVLVTAEPSDLMRLEAHERVSFPGDPQGYCLLASIIDDGGGYLWREGDTDLAYALIQGCLGQAEAALIFSFAVLPAARARGHGKAFLRALVDHLAAQGIHRLQLFCGPNNAPALKLYRATGFEVVSQHPALFGPGEDRVRMVREEGAAALRPPS